VFWDRFTIKLDILTKYYMSNILRLTLSIIVCAAFAIGSIISVPPAAAGEYVANFKRIPAVEDRPPQVATWNLTPTVIVCESAPISQTQTKSAVRFWKNLGYRFFRTRYKHDPLEKCGNPNPIGYIVVHMVTLGIKLEDSALAQTHFYVDNETNHIEWAIIYLRTGVRETVLEHEIGHALGFLHYDKLDHLMNQKWTQGGWNTSGLESRPR